MNRRLFLTTLGLGVAAPKAFFDMGLAWQRHDNGLYLPGAVGYAWHYPYEVLSGSGHNILALEADLERLWTDDHKQFQLTGEFSVPRDDEES